MIVLVEEEDDDDEGICADTVTFMGYSSIRFATMSASGNTFLTASAAVLYS
jgi:hypothetical protein